MKDRDRYDRFLMEDGCVSPQVYDSKIMRRSETEKELETLNKIFPNMFKIVEITLSYEFEE